MLDKKDILQITRDAVSELMGMGFDGSTETDLGALDLSKLVEFGTNLTQNGTTITNELWGKTIIGKCADFIVENRKFKLDIPSIFKTSYEWGGFIEVVKFDLAGIYDSLIYSQQALTTQGNKFYGKTIAEIEHDMYKTTYDSKIYKEFKDFMIPYTKPNDSIKSGFTSATQLMKFIAGLETAIENTLTVIINTFSHALISSAIAYASSIDGTSAGAEVAGSDNAIHLVTEYKDFTGDNTWTAEKMLLNDTAMAWVAERIANVREFIKDNTGVYNNHERAMPAIGAKGVMLTHFKNRYEYTVARTSYNPITLGEWDTVNAWQAVNSLAGEYDFATSSAIQIKKDTKKGIYGYDEDEETLTDVSLNNVIAVVFDEKAIGITVDREKVTTAYTAVTDTTNIFINKTLNYICDTDYAIVPFILD